MSLDIGANALSQLYRFALCLLLGIGSGVFALLYFRKASFFERMLTDFFATVCIGGAFILCIEFALSGKFEIYGAMGFLMGCLAIPSIFKFAKKRKKSKNDK